MLPLSPGRAERHGFEYYRHGTLSLYAALDVKTGRVEGHTAKRDTSAEFLVFLRGCCGKRAGQERFTSCWTISPPTKPKRCRSFCKSIPESASISRPRILPGSIKWNCGLPRSSATLSRGVFTSVADLARKLRKYIRAYAKLAKPFRRTYIDPSRRIRTYGITGTAY